MHAQRTPVKQRKERKDEPIKAALLGSNAVERGTTACATEEGEEGVRRLELEEEAMRRTRRCGREKEKGERER